MCTAHKTNGSEWIRSTTPCPRDAGAETKEGAERQGTPAYACKISRLRFITPRQLRPFPDRPIRRPRLDSAAIAAQIRSRTPGSWLSVCLEQI